MTQPRAAVHSLLEEDSTLSQLGVSSVFAADSVDTPPDEVYIVVRWGTSGARLVGTKSSKLCTFYVHDRDRDFSRIDKIIARVKDLLLASIHVPGDDGVTLTMAVWNQDGPDGRDEGANTSMRWTEVSILAR